MQHGDFRYKKIQIRAKEAVKKVSKFNFSKKHSRF